jgi:hypothetical protein
MDEDLETLIVALNKVAKSESRVRDLAAQRLGKVEMGRFPPGGFDAPAETALPHADAGRR